MVSPSKKRQIKGRVTTGRRSDRKGDKASGRLPYRPLLNKKFYLDVKGYKGTATITADIHNLGGVVEEFFSREVNYVISSRGTQATGGSSSEQQPSPTGVPTASPLTPHQPLSSVPSTSHDSPLNIDSPREDTGKKRVRTRAEVLLERACVRRQGTSDLFENARLWNVPVWPLAKLLKWLSVLKENGHYRPQKTQGALTSKSSSTSSSPKVRRLTAPFIKTESFTREYKPLYKELSIWPELNLSNPPGVSPFADPKQAKAHQNPKTSSVHRDDHREKHAKDRNRGTKIKDRGYCELCTTNYTSLRLHLQSDTHTAFVRNNKNYLYLDELISGHRQSSQHLGNVICERVNPSNFTQKVCLRFDGYTDICRIQMRYSGLMQSEKRPASLSSVANKRLRKQIVFEIGETIHSGPTLVAQEKLKDEDVAAKSNCVFPGDTQENACVLRKSCHQAEIPSTRHCSPQLPTSPCPAGQPQPEPHLWHTHCDVGAKVQLKASLPAALVPEAIVPEIIVPKISDLEATIPHVIVTQTAVPEAPIAEAAVPELLVNKASVPELILNEAAVPEVTVNKSAVPQDKVTETALPETAVNEIAIPKDKITELHNPDVSVNEATYKNTAIETAVLEIKYNEVLQDKVNEGGIPKEKLNKTTLLTDKENEAVVPAIILNEGISHQNKKREAAIPKLNVNETATPGAPSNEAIPPEVTKSEANLPKAFEIKPVVTEVAEAIGTEHTTATPNLSVSVAALSEDLPLGTTPAHQASLPVVTQENREMVRLIQEADAKLDSFCPKRSSRASKRLSSADFEAVEIKSEPVSRAKRCTRTRKSSCRSDKSESETSDSRSVADESLYFDMVDKTTKRGKPKNGEPLLDEAATHISAKYNGDVSSELVNGTHKVKGRRISRANSDESDCSSASRSNGNVDHNSDKLDFSLLLEISPADRKKFESKKAKIRRKTADWQLISETERYYNEKEEIMRNKNKLESDSESDESDDGTENQDSKSDCSDESEGMANPPRGRGKGKCKHSRTVDEDDSKPTAKRIKDDPCVSKKRGRPIGSRNRKTRYDLTMLNDDDDDDNFFGFPVSTTIPQTTQSSSAVCSSSTQTRGKGKGGNKSTPEASSSSGKSGRKRLSDAERFLRDNREYYHFQETPERLRRSTSSSADKEKVTKVDESEGKEADKKEETKLKDTSTAKKQPTAEGRRRVTRSTGGTLEDPEAEERDEAKIVEKDEIKDVVKLDNKSTEKNEAKDKERDKRKVSVEDKKKICLENKRKMPEEDNRKAFEDDKKKANEDKRKATEDDVRKATEDEKKKVAEEDRIKVEEDKRKITEEDKRKVTEEDQRKITEEKRKVTEENKRKVSEDDKRKVTEEDKRKIIEADNRKVTEESKRKGSDEVRRITSEADRRKVTEEGKKTSEEEKKRNTEEEKKNISEENKVKDIEVGKKIELEVDKRIAGLDDKISFEDDHVKKQLLNLKTKVPSDSESSENTGKGNVVEILENKDGSRSVLQDLYFSFEGVPVQESWYQTYQRLIDGIDINEFAYEEEPLKFVLPYEMPKEYVRDFLCYKKGMLSKKKNDLADLVRKSPRCHASTLALFSDIIPTKKVKGAKVTRSVPVKVDEASSDGTSTPGAESTRMQPPECFESAEELAILALHIDHFMKSESCSEELPICNPHLDELKEGEEPDFKKTPPKKRGKKKRLLGGSKSDKGSQENIAKELKLFESPLAHEVDPVFIAGLCDEVKDYLTPENILAREASEVIEDSCFCVCTDRASCDEFSSADDNTEASSECVSLCDSETVDGSVVSEPKRCRSGKKRRKNLTGWPKAQKKKKPVPSHTSDDNDSAIGCDDLEPKKQGHWKKHDDFSLLEQTTTQKLAALAACDRRASPRKKASVLYMDTWPVRYRTQK